MTLWIYSLMVFPGALIGKNNNCMHDARAAHFFQHLFADYDYDEKMPNFTFYGGQHKTTTDGSSLHLTRSVSWNSRDKDWKNANLLFKSVSCFAALDFNKVPTIQRKQGIKLQPKKSALFKVDQLCQSDVHQRAMVGATGTRKINPPFRHNFGLSYDNFTP